MRRVFYVTTAFLIIWTGAFAQKTYVLKQNFKAGKTYTFKISADQILDQEEVGRNVSTSQQVGTHYAFDVLSDSLDFKRIKVSYKQITFHSSTQGEQVDYNSDQDSLGKKSKFGNLKNEFFFMVLGPDGVIRSVTGLEKIVSHLAAKMAADSTEIAYYQNSLFKQFNPDVIKESLEASFKIYPDKAVKIGESWTVDMRVQMSMPVNHKTTYTLKEIKGDTAVLSVHGTLLSQGEFSIADKKSKADLKGTNSGEISIQLQTGMIVNSHLRVDFFGTIDQKFNFELEAINEIIGQEL